MTDHSLKKYVMLTEPQLVATAATYVALGFILGFIVAVVVLT